MGELIFQLFLRLVDVFLLFMLIGGGLAFTHDMEGWKAKAGGLLAYGIIMTFIILSYIRG